MQPFLFPYVPIPEEGETVYSVFCRLSMRSGLGLYQISKMITNKNRINYLAGALPGFLKHISLVMPLGHPWKETENIINNNTNLNYFIYFDSPLQRDELVKHYSKIVFSYPLALRLGLSVQKWIVPVAHPRYCPQCAEEQLDRLGFTYFRREHYLPCVCVCWKHNCNLIYGCRNCGPYPSKGNPVTIPGKCNCSTGFSPLLVPSLYDVNSSLQWIARESAYIVKSTGKNYKNIKETLRDLLRVNFFFNGQFLSSAAIIENLKNKFTLDLFSFLGYRYSRAHSHMTWVKRTLSLIRPLRRNQTILYMFFVGLIFESIHEFENYISCLSYENTDQNIKPEKLIVVKPRDEYIKSEADLEIFKRKRGWLQAIAHHFGVSSLIIAREIKTKGYRLPLSNRTRKRIGEDNISIIIGYLKDGVSKIEIQKKCSISDWTLMLIELYNPGIAAEHYSKSKRSLIKKHRNNLLAFLADNPKEKRGTVREKLRVTFEYLFKNDKEWLDEKVRILPKKITRKKIEIFLNYKKIDKEKAILLKKILQNELKSGLKPVKITKKFCLKHVNMLGTYYRNYKKFPCVTAIILKFVESYPDFVKRRILWALNKAKETDRVVSINMLRRECSLNEIYLKANNGFIIEQARKFGVKINERSSLA